MLKGCLNIIVIVVLLIGAVALFRNVAPNPVDIEGTDALEREAPADPYPAAVVAAPVRPYAEDLREALAAVPAITGTAATLDDLQISLLMINAWSEVAQRGETMALSAEDEATRLKLIAALGKVQSKVLPELRDAYGPLLREVLWEHDAKARTIGTGFRTIELVAGEYAANRNIKATQEEMYETLMQMRFTRAQYRWYEGAPKYTYYTLEPPKDSEVVVWSSYSFAKVK